MQSPWAADAHAAIVYNPAGKVPLDRIWGAVVAQERLHSSGTPVALLPGGTGNLLARNLDLPLGDIDGSVQAAFGGAPRPVDVGVAELEDESGNRRSEEFLVMAGIGLDARMAEDTSALAKRHLGLFGPGLALVAAPAR